MPKKRTSRSPPPNDEDDDFFYEESGSVSGRDCREPQHRNAANARERARMRVLSKAFCRLKTTLPWVPADTKLSKLDTLRLAASYIAHLRALLRDEPSQLHPHPLSMAWPFAFQHGGGPAPAPAASPRAAWSPPRGPTPPREAYVPQACTAAAENPYYEGYGAFRENGYALRSSYSDSLLNME